MNTVTRIVAGLLLIAHGLVHLLYLVSEPDDESYPFTLRDSWLVPESARRPVASTHRTPAEPEPYCLRLTDAGS